MLIGDLIQPPVKKPLKTYVYIVNYINYWHPIKKKAFTHLSYIFIFSLKHAVKITAAVLTLCLNEFLLALAIYFFKYI